jgi:hypothetical protein
MRGSSPQAGLLLPFGSLTGIIPVDALSRGRVLGDFSKTIDRDRSIAGRPATPVVAGPYPACAAWPPSFREEDGGI